jgi:hypothetical protein
MKTYLEPIHRQRIESLGWNATITDWHRNGCSLRIRNTNYSLIRSGNGFMPTCVGKPIWHEPTCPDAAFGIIWRYSRSIQAEAIIEHIRKS